MLEGDRLVNTPYDIKFRVDKENEDLCSRELTAKDLKRLRTAVKKDYYFQVKINLFHFKFDEGHSLERSRKARSENFDVVCRNSCPP